jgi:type IV pilus assembly protein PilC
MALFSYTATDQSGRERSGTIEALNIDIAIAALQRRQLIVSSVEPAGESKSIFERRIKFFDRVPQRDIVMLSRQVSTLFSAQISALRAFQLLAAEAQNLMLQKVLSDVASEIQSGSPISAALKKHPEVFSPFYVNMVRAGEEAGKLDDTFTFLADYLDRNYEITQKTKNALVYPAFMVITFITVMTLMMTMVIPRLAVILEEVGQDIPIYTKIIIGISNFITNYILLLGILLAVFIVFSVRYARTNRGKLLFARARLQIPHVGDIYRKLFLSRFADNMSTMLRSGIQMVRAMEVTAVVVGDPVYEQILTQAVEEVRSGQPVSETLRAYPEIPGIVVAMIKVGEETGNLSEILDTMARFYRREVNNSVDTLVGLIEPFMIVGLAVGVGFLLAAVLVPIYNISASF